MRYILLLRGINLGRNRRVAMPELRAALAAAGYRAARTHLQSGNIVLRANADPGELERSVSDLIGERFGLEVPVVARTADELAQVVALDPLGDVATDPKRYQVSFCVQPPSADAIERLRAAVAGEEQVSVHGREIYAWHPDGIARSKLWNGLAGGGLGTAATSRNWATVMALHQMTEEL